MSDGYLDIPEELRAPFDCDPETLQKFGELQNLYKEQSQIDAELKELNQTIDEMPKLPHSIEFWLGSFDTGFKLSDFKKMFAINKQYQNLIDKRDKNGQKIKLFMIENVLQQIKEVNEMTQSKKDN